MAILNSLVEATDIIQELIPLDCSVTIFDSEGTILAFVPPKTFSLNVTVGNKATRGGTIEECLVTGLASRKFLSAELYGVPVKSVSIPAKENGTIVGGISIGLSLAAQNTLSLSVQAITATSKEVAAASQELATTAIELAEALSSMKEYGESVSGSVRKTDGILQFVSEVAANSNLLGLNAAIEAARAGEAGRGFAVVADEIRKMAANSETAVKEINIILDKIKDDSGRMAEIVSNTAILGERQSAATEEISASMEQLVSTAQEVEKVAEIL